MFFPLGYKKFCSNFYKSLTPGRAAGGKSSDGVQKGDNIEWIY